MKDRHERGGINGRGRNLMEGIEIRMKEIEETRQGRRSKKMLQKKSKWNEIMKYKKQEWRGKKKK